MFKDLFRFSKIQSVDWNQHWMIIKLNSEVRDASYKVSKNLISNFGLCQDENHIHMTKTNLNSNAWST